MQFLSLNFLLYSLTGLWRPIHWTSSWSKLVYSLYTIIMIYLLAFVIVTESLHIIFVIDSVEEFASVSMIYFSYMSVFFKAVTVLIYRGQIVDVIETFESKPCKACNEVEFDVQLKYDRMIRSYTIYFIILCAFSCTGAVAAEVLNALDGRLPNNVWMPWDCTSFFAFLIIYFKMCITLTIATIINVATETTILGLCLKMCAQFEILKHRLENMSKKREMLPAISSLRNTVRQRYTLSENVSHHLCIIRLASEVNNVYNCVIFVQFFVSILVLCSILYHMSSNLTVKKCATMLVYTFSMFVQIFIYCISGDQVMTKSSSLGNVVYHIDWMFMTVSERKDLLMIMKRSTKPVKFTSSFLVTLSLESYGNLLKATFSAFNLLQQL